jgi:hypothetical protein
MGLKLNGTHQLLAYADDVTLLKITFNSILYYLCAESTATGPITDPAQYRYT